MIAPAPILLKPAVGAKDCLTPKRNFETRRPQLCTLPSPLSRGVLVHALIGERWRSNVHTPFRYPFALAGSITRYLGVARPVQIEPTHPKSRAFRMAAL
jgi:hypothetical protein